MRPLSRLRIPTTSIFQESLQLVIQHSHKCFAPFIDPLRLHACKPAPTIYTVDDTAATDLALSSRQGAPDLQFKLVRGMLDQSRLGLLLCIAGKGRAVL